MQLDTIHVYAIIINRSINRNVNFYNVSSQKFSEETVTTKHPQQSRMLSPGLKHTPWSIKTYHFTFHYNSRISWWILHTEWTNGNRKEYSTM